MVLRFLWGKGDSALDRVEDRLQAMLAHVHHEFGLAMSALVGDVVAGEVNHELRTTDRKVNRLEREIRRELVVHASVFGGLDSPAVLVYMSIVKDIERVGDYAKNLLDLALDGARFAELPQEAEWRRLSSEVSQFILDAGEAFRFRDDVRSRNLREWGDGYLELFDEQVSELIRAEDPGAQAVARALAYRYIKRVVAHLMNLLSAIVVPLDRLDFFDEDPEDRQRG